MNPYPPKYKLFYDKLSKLAGMSNTEIDVFIIRLIKIIERELNKKGTVIVPYFGKFYLKRLPARKRSIVDFATGKRYMVNIPARDNLKFKVNKKFRKLFL